MELHFVKKKKKNGFGDIQYPTFLMTSGQYHFLKYQQALASKRLSEGHYYKYLQTLQSHSLKC